jgi:hypothetical protein
MRFFAIPFRLPPWSPSGGNTRLGDPSSGSPNPSPFLADVCNGCTARERPHLRRRPDSAALRALSNPLFA